MRRMGYVGLALAFLLTPVVAKSADLQDAFKAAFGKAPPIMRYVSLPQIGKTDIRLEPVSLVHVVGRRFALVVSESFDGAHWAPGDVAVSYLDRYPAGWQPVKVWYEFTQSGSFGKPFSRRNLLSFNFGGMPFFAGEGEWCGMGACLREYDLIGFSSNGPEDWGKVASSGTLESIYTIPDGKISNGDVLTGCGGYEYSSVISAPRNKGDVMRMTYTGWMIPGGAGQNRRAFHFSTELFLMHGNMKSRSAFTLPNCGY